MTAHVFMGYNYYPMAGLGDYKKSFYGEDAIRQAGHFIDTVFDGDGSDWWKIIADNGDGLIEVSGDYRVDSWS